MDFLLGNLVSGGIGALLGAFAAYRLQIRGGDTLAVAAYLTLIPWHGAGSVRTGSASGRPRLRPG